MVLRDPKAARIEIAGQVMMPAPTGISPADALNNFDELVREWTCNREMRMTLEASVLCLQSVVEDRDAQTAKVLVLEKRVAEFEAEAEAEAKAAEGDSAPAVGEGGAAQAS